MLRAMTLFYTAAALAACGSLPLEIGAAGRDGGSTITGDRHHPNDWALPENHGLGLKTQSEDCRQCHGGDLTGGGSAPVGCDGCHASGAGWRTDCTFCHGGTDNQTGAPPRDLRGATDRASLTFPAHTAHVTASANHVAFDCTSCHVKPTDVLSAGHVFDDTPDGKSEVTFAGGLSPTGTYATGTCSTLYCHGTGVGSTGSVRVSDGARNCGSCHAASPTTGQHSRHRRLGYACYECHGDTVDQSGNIVRPELHVNGRKDTKFGTSTIVFRSGTCTGTCHGQGHQERW